MACGDGPEAVRLAGSTGSGPVHGQPPAQAPTAADPAARSMRPVPAVAAGGLTREAAEALLLLEARLLDERRFEEWLDLFTPDGRYVLPSGEDDAELALIDDDRATLEDRVTRLRSPAAHAQSPPSRTLHIVSGVEVEALGAGPAEALADGREARVHSVCIVYEARLGMVRSFAGRCRHVLRTHPGQPAWRIASKTVWLVDRDQPLYNLTFLI